MAEHQSVQSIHSAAARACGRCDGTLELLTLLPRRFDHPGYSIFRCMACESIEWISEPAQA